jgi:hypothetical protein
MTWHVITMLLALWLTGVYPVKAEEKRAEK